MDRETWMYVRVAAPGMVFMAGGVVLALVLSGLPDSPMGAGLLQPMRYAAMALIGVGLLHAGYHCVDAWLRSNGNGPFCPCGAPLGEERQGRYSPVRDCLGCGKAVGRRWYH